MNLIEKINRSIGFTQNEIRVVLFLVTIFIIGSGIKIYKTAFTTSEHVFNYVEADAVFKQKSEYSASNMNPIPDSIQTQTEAPKKKNLPSTKSININKASKLELMKLPGVGEVTAERIITYRENVKLFKTYNDLLNVKGVGKKKLDQIKPYIIFE
jgi:competence protein ComEA